MKASLGDGEGGVVIEATAASPIGPLGESGI